MSRSSCLSWTSFLANLKFSQLSISMRCPSFDAGFLVAKLALLVAVSATCYYPDGSAVTDTDFQPCVATIGTFSMVRVFCVEVYPQADRY